MIFRTAKKHFSMLFIYIEKNILCNFLRWRNDFLTRYGYEQYENYLKMETIIIYFSIWTTMHVKIVVKF